MDNISQRLFKIGSEMRHNLLIVSQGNSPSLRGAKRQQTKKDCFQHQHHLDNLQFLSILKKRPEGQSLVVASSIARALITGFDPRTGPDASTRQLLLQDELRKGMLAKWRFPLRDPTDFQCVLNLVVVACFSSLLAQPRLI
jgi:hypothetical protein